MSTSRTVNANPVSAGLVHTNHMYVNDTKAAGVEGGASTAGVTTRTLNTVVVNNILGASLASNQVTLPAGTYWIEASVTQYIPNRGRAYIYNVTDSALVMIGQSVYATIGAEPTVKGYMTIASSKVIQLRQYASTGQATNGLGVASPSGNPEIYSQLYIWKVG